MLADQHFRLRIAQNLADVPATAWDACANPPDASGEGERFNPFLAHAFLHALETTAASARAPAGARRMS